MEPSGFHVPVLPFRTRQLGRISVHPFAFFVFRRLPDDLVRYLRLKESCAAEIFFHLLDDVHLLLLNRRATETLEEC